MLAAMYQAWYFISVSIAMAVWWYFLGSIAYHLILG